MSATSSSSKSSRSTRSIERDPQEGLTLSFSDLLCQSPVPQCGHVRISTLPFAEGAFSRISSKWQRQQAEGTIRRITASKPPSWMLTYALVRSASRRGLFLVLHPNIALSPERARGPRGKNLRFFSWGRSAHNFVSTPFSARYVRPSTRLAEKGVLSRSASKYRAQASKRMCRCARTRRLSFEDGFTRRSAKLAPWANFRPRLQVAAR